MKVAIMQPYFFPYLGYFSLIEATDQWIVFDTPQYIRKGWVNRNRVLKKGGGWKYIRIKTKKAPRETPINKIKIDNSEDWISSLINNLDFYQESNAPYYQEVIDFLNHTFSLKSDNLSESLIHFLERTCTYLGLKFNYQVFSKMNLPLGSVEHPGEWALRICECLGADTYLNPLGGREIFRKEQFRRSNIDLLFLSHKLPPYFQQSENFFEGLSIIDVMMFNSIDEIKAMLKKYKLER